jgi:glycosyltransferase involved in cell wall biosynthesis
MIKGLFIFGFPVSECQGTLYFGARACEDTVRCCRAHLDSVGIVARRRETDRNTSNVSSLVQEGAELLLELPDFGEAGLPGYWRLLRLLSDPRIRRKLDCLVERSAFIYVEGVSLEAFVVARSAKRLNKHVVLEIRGEALNNKRYMMARFGICGIFYAWLAGRLFRHTCRQTSAALYLNGGQVARYGIEGAVISDVDLPADTGERAQEVPTQPAQKYLYVGALDIVKRVDLLLVALARANGRLPRLWRFTVVGDGPEKPRLMALAHRLGIATKVDFLDYISDRRRLFETYRSSDLLLIASFTETGPRVLVEAMRVGLPILSADVGLASELLDSRMLVENWKESTWADVIVSVVHDGELLGRVARQNRERSNEFDARTLHARRASFFAERIRLAAGVQAGGL